MKSKFIMTLVFIMLIFTISLISIPGLSNTGIDVVSAATTSNSAPEPVVTPKPVVTPEITSNPEINNYSKSPSNWAVNDVNDAKSIGLDLNNIEAFDKPLTRKEFVKVIMNFYSLVSDTSMPVSGVNPYSDTTNSQIIKTYELGIVKGIDNTRFNPDGLLTRQEASLILYRLFNNLSPGVNYSSNVLHEFSDSADISSWAYESIQFMYDHKILLGTSQNTIKPKEFITLEQSVALFMRTYKNPDFVKQVDINSSTTNSTDDDD